MPTPESLGKLLMLMGAILLGLGALFTLAGRIGWLGKLPGDFRFERGGFSFYFPLATSLLLSILLTLIINLFRRH
ncbi:MAG TPA: DUF2905 domain-containing protein [Candidatus Polarisedimenticolia bacterium]|jgi:hypothetical protein|nr:DUF2905 domain-containing protein [Candidatus Polarisedimenticolia bacterium]